MENADHLFSQSNEEKIEAFLSQLEKKYDIIILLAVECGSRSWNLNSPTSDYDVRFIYRNVDMIRYIHRNVDTLNVEDGELDFQGWNVNKAFEEAGKGNMSLFEWLYSPIRYRVLSEEGKPKIEEILKSIYSKPQTLDRLWSSYRGFCLASIKALDNPRRGIKNYLYTTRSILILDSGRDSLEYNLEKLIREHGDKSSLPAEPIQSVIELKRAGATNSDLIQGKEKIHQWILTNYKRINDLHFEKNGDPGELSRPLFETYFRANFK